VLLRLFGKKSKENKNFNRLAQDKQIISKISQQRKDKTNSINDTTKRIIWKTEELSLLCKI